MKAFKQSGWRAQREARKHNRGSNSNDAYDYGGLDQGSFFILYNLSYLSISLKKKNKKKQSVYQRLGGLLSL